MRIAGFREKLLSGAMLAGTFVKTPAHEIVEVLARSDLDFLCLDAEHCAFDRGRLDACLAVARALDFPVLVRVPAGLPHEILSVLDGGAVGIVVPHVMDGATAAQVAKAAHFGHGGRGFAGSTRWAGITGAPMPEVLARTKETVVLAQIEEPEGVEAAADIAGTEGIDGLFVGPADLSVSLGETQLGSEALDAAMAKVGAATRAAGKAYVTFVPTAAHAEDWKRHGFTVFLVASEHVFMRLGAAAAAGAIHALEDSA